MASWQTGCAGGLAVSTRVSARVSARRVAFRVLRDVHENDAYANLVLPGYIKRAGLDARDAAFATELAAGTLRLLGLYDRIIESASRRNVKDIEPAVLDVLRLGCHQILNTRTAMHAAVNESVQLAKKEGLYRAAGFINAVLRKVSKKSLSEWKAGEPDSVTYAHPQWIIDAFEEALEAEGRSEELLALLEADNTAPRISLANLTGKSLAQDVSALTSGTLTPGISPIGYKLHGGEPISVIAALGFDTQKLRVQDEGSQLAALALVAAKPIADGESWLDLCAGPGGKTAVLAAQAVRPGVTGLSGVTVRANEVSPHRTNLVAESTVAFSDVVTLSNHDGRTSEAFGGKIYDRILVDAPCSGIGALRRRPEARWRKQEHDLAELTVLQSELLAEAAKHVARGGVIAYVTCSPHLRETRAIVENFLRQQNGAAESTAASVAKFRELDTKQILREVVEGESDSSIDLGDGPELSAQLWPHRHETDAMFISLLQRQ